MEGQSVSGFGLEGKVAVVTGASSGIGAAVRQALLDEGCRVANLDLTTPPAEDSATEDGASDNVDRSIFVETDVTSDGSVADAVAAVAQWAGAADILVNCAGIIVKQPVDGIDFETWDRVFDVNLKGTVRMIRDLTPQLTSSGRYGRIINISSMTANFGLETYSPYSSSKAAVSNVTKVAALELAPFGVTVNALCPGWVDTPMAATGLIDHLAKLHGISRDDAEARVMDFIPQHRFIRPEEIAHAVSFLASPLAQAISSTELRIDMGLTQTFTPGFHQVRPRVIS